MAAPRPNRISKQNTNVPLSQLIQDLDEKHIIVPPHQREFCWDLKRQQKFIQSILKGYPIPSILMSSRRVDPHPTLEDGRQRLTTASRYRSGKFQVLALDGQMRNYAELSDIDRERFDNEAVIVITFSNANDDDRIQIFDWHQNGAPLSPGERYHAQHSSPLISFVKELLMTPGSGYHDRAAAIWGNRGDPVAPPEGFISADKRRKWLLGATALVLGLVYGPSNATKKYDSTVEAGFITADIPAMRKLAVKKDLERIFEIYEAVQARCPPRKTKQWVNANWDLGTFTGYILYSLSYHAREVHEEFEADEAPEEKIPFENGIYEPNSLREEPETWARIKACWVNYMVTVRRTINETPTKKIKAVLEECIHKGQSKARSWTNARWDLGYRHVFGLPVGDVASISEGDEESDEEESE